MRKVTIRDLHATTGKYVRRVKDETLLITDHGQVVAVLKAVSPSEHMGVPFPKDHWKRAHLPSSKGDSTSFISEDRSR